MVVLRVSASGNTNDSDDELHDDHSCASNDEDLTATEAFDRPERYRGGEDIDERCNEGDEERVADRAEGGEEDCSEVEDEVDTGQLLHHLHKNT